MKGIKSKFRGEPFICVWFLGRDRWLNQPWAELTSSCQHKTKVPFCLSTLLGNKDAGVGRQASLLPGLSFQGPLHGSAPLTTRNMAGTHIASLSDTASWFSTTADQRIAMATAGANISRSLESCWGQQNSKHCHQIHLIASEHLDEEKRKFNRYFPGSRFWRAEGKWDLWRWSIILEVVVMG